MITHIESMYGIFPYIYHQPNVGKNIPYIDLMGITVILDMKIRVSIWVSWEFMCSSVRNRFVCVRVFVFICVFSMLFIFIVYIHDQSTNPT